MEFSDTGFTGSAPPDPLILPELITAVTRLDQMSASVPVGAPWKAANAAAWDAETLAELDRGELGDRARSRRLVPAATRPIFGADPNELSLLFVLFYIAASGNESNAGELRAQLQHPRRRPGVADRGRLAGPRRRRWQRRSAKRRIVKRSPVRRIVQRQRPRPGRLRPRRRHRQARDRRGPAGARGADRLPPGDAARPRRAHPAARRRAR